jgi:hypothetical protein
MSAAHLRAVPDPVPGPDEEPGPGERTAHTPTAVPPADQLDHEGQADEERPAETRTVGEWSDPSPLAPPLNRPDDDQLDDDDRADDRRRSRGIMTIPRDLHQYYDVRQLGVYKEPLIEAGRRGAPILLRALGRTMCVLGRGLRVLLALVVGWLSGDIGRRGSRLARLGGAVFALYFVVRMSIASPAGPWAVAAALLLVTALAGLDRLPVPDAVRPKKGKAPKRAAASPATGGPKPRKDTNRAGPRAGLVTRLRGLRRAAADSPAQDRESAPEEDRDDEPEGASEEVPEEEWEDPGEVPSEAPVEHSPQALIEALNHLTDGRRGVLLTLLADHLGYPDTGALKGALSGAGIRWRGGVRCTTGNGPGVHPADIPPLPSPPGVSQGSSVCAGQEPTPTPTPTPTATEEALRVVRMDSDVIVSPPDATRHFTV